MDHFQKRFHAGTTGGKVGAIFGVYNAGCFIGGPFGAFTMDRFGRRCGMVAGSVLIVAGSVLTSTATKLVQVGAEEGGQSEADKYSEARS